MSRNRLKLWLGFTKWILGTFLLGLAGVLGNMEYQGARIELARLDQERIFLESFVDHAMSEEVLTRLRLAHYIKTTATETKVKSAWDEFYMELLQLCLDHYDEPEVAADAIGFQNDQFDSQEDLEKHSICIAGGVRKITEAKSATIVGGRMRISDQIAYPNFRDWLKDALPTVTKRERVWKAFKKHGELNDFSAFQAVNWVDSAPGILVEPLGPLDSAFDPERPDQISISQEIVERFEIDHELEIAKRLVEAAVLRGLVHWGDHRDGIDQPGNEGLAFEREAYGEDVGRYWTEDRVPID